MLKPILFLEDISYQQNVVNAARRDGAILLIPFSSKIEKNAFRFHNAWPLNRNRELPGKSFWFNRILNENEIPHNSTPLFIFYESFHLAYSAIYLKYLKEKYPNAKFCFVFSNPVSKYTFEKLQAVRHFYSIVITFSEKDSVYYDFAYYGYLPCWVPPVAGTDKKSDVFFIGTNKGRAQKLIAVYERLSSVGLECDFHMTGVAPYMQKHPDKISYNQPLSYDSVLRKVKASSCVLEILQGDNAYCSIRAIEAFTYRKKLLTTNSSIVREPFYKSSIIQFFTSPESIDIDFFEEAPESASFPNVNLWSFSSFVSFIQDRI